MGYAQSAVGREETDGTDGRDERDGRDGTDERMGRTGEMGGMRKVGGMGEIAGLGRRKEIGPVRMPNSHRRLNIAGVTVLYRDTDNSVCGGGLAQAHWGRFATHEGIGNRLLPAAPPYRPPRRSAGTIVGHAGMAGPRVARHRRKANIVR